jgi:CheY-like chemotaxis protein
MSILAKCVDIDVFSARRHIGSDDEYFALLTEFIQTAPYFTQELTSADTVRDSWLFQKKIFELQRLLLPIGAIDLLWEAEQASKLAKREEWEKCAEQAAALVLSVTRLSGYLQSALNDPGEVLAGSKNPSRNPDMITYDDMIVYGAGASVKKRILAIDDMPDILLSIKAILKIKYEVFAVTNHMSALQVLAHKDPDLILLDIEIPDKNGFDILRLIRKIRGYESTPVIFLTGNVTTDNIRRSQAAGGNDFIRKPIDPQVLLSKIDKYL